MCLDSSESPLASQSQECFLMHTLDQFFTLSHTQPLHNSHLNTGFLIAELQANLAHNKVNTWLNKFNITILLSYDFSHNISVGLFHDKKVL